MEKCGWTGKLLKDFEVSSPEQISSDLINNAFPQQETSTNPADLFHFEKGGFRMDTRPHFNVTNGSDAELELDQNYHVASRFSEQQRKLLAIAQMCLFDVFRGVVHNADGNQRVEEVSDLTIRELTRQTNVFPNISPTFRDGLMTALWGSINTYARGYPNLVRPLQYELEHVGGLGVAKSILEARSFLADGINGELTQENRDCYRKDLRAKSHFVKAYATHESQCLAPHLAIEIHEQAKTAAIKLGQDDKIKAVYDPLSEERNNSVLFLVASLKSLFNQVSPTVR